MKVKKGKRRKVTSTRSASVAKKQSIETKKAVKVKVPLEQADILKPGDKVIIYQNPHQPGADGIVGTVIVYRPGEGFASSDLVEVHYKNPRDGQGYTMPFGLSCLGAADPASLVGLAERYEALAAYLRDCARTQREAK